MEVFQGFRAVLQRIIAIEWLLWAAPYHIKLLSKVDFSVVAPIFYRQFTSRSSRSIISISSTKLLSLLFRKVFFSIVFFISFSPVDFWLERELGTDMRYYSTFNKKTPFPRLTILLPLSRQVCCAVVWWMHSAKETGQNRVGDYLSY